MTDPRPEAPAGHDRAVPTPAVESSPGIIWATLDAGQADIDPRVRRFYRLCGAWRDGPHDAAVAYVRADRADARVREAEARLLRIATSYANLDAHPQEIVQAMRASLGLADG